MRNLPRCSCVTRNGSPCGRRVSDGSNPPVCHVHRLQQQGKGTSPLTEPAPFDEITKLTKIARNDRHPQQLQAIKMLREFKREQPAIDHSHAFVKALSEEERAELHVLLSALDKFKERIYARESDLRPDSEIAPRPISTEEIDHEEPTRRPAEPISEPPAELAGPAAEAGRDQREHRQTRLSRDKWRAVGLFEERGFVTHALGDDHAEKILAGEISYEDAVSDQQNVLREADQMACGHLRRLP